MHRLLFVRPADDSTAVVVAAYGQAVRQMASGFVSTDLCGPQASRHNVDGELAASSSLFYFGHGTDAALVANGVALVDQDNLRGLNGGLVVAIACYASLTLGGVAGVSHPNVAAFLGFDDEVGIPLQAPVPMGEAVVEGLRCLVTNGHTIACAADQMRARFDQARAVYKMNGPLFGMSPSDTRTAWLFAKSNRYSIQVRGDGSAVL
jgi:hypothetical protein